ncbi:MAG: glycosyltransferase [Thermoleophilia bacterium]|nr:glycosyltransferase [Thermoleophilia bacterium]
MPKTLQNQPRISVVTPSYNQDEFLEATLRSVISQGYPNLEYVVIDGGSTDDSVNIIKRYEADLAYWVTEPDEGHAQALNKGFAHTTGEIMCWINSSDMYYPWTFETVAEVFSQLPQVDWITGTSSIFDVHGRPRAVASAAAVNVFDILVGDYRSIQQESVFWRRSLWDRAGGRLDQTLTCAADLDLWLRFFRLARLYHVGTILGGFRVHDEPLGKAGHGLYEREAKELHVRFASRSDPRSLARARLVRLIGTGKRRRAVAERLSEVGILPWYRHPRVWFDFDRMVWTLG